MAEEDRIPTYILERANHPSEMYFDKVTGRNEPYPHGLVTKNWDGTHTCDYCGLAGDYNDVLIVKACTERPEPCKWCGESPLCAEDCVGIMLALSDPSVYVAGNDTPEEAVDAIQ